jgi:1-phosphatidylinositol-3-phosphate 5-kinase
LYAVSELLKLEELPEKWHDIVLSLSLDAVDQVETKTSDSIDVRCLIKIKKLPGGVPEDCCIVPGEAFTLRVHQRDIVRRLDRPKILLVAGAISCHRDNTNGYVDMESLVSMEDEYIRRICNKLKSFRPDLILVETTVSQKAQAVLSELGIAYVFNVRASIMARLRRIFQTEMHSSVLSIIHPPTLGAASKFEIR